MACDHFFLPEMKLFSMSGYYMWAAVDFAQGTPILTMFKFYTKDDKDHSLFRKIMDEEAQRATISLDYSKEPYD